MKEKDKQLSYDMKYPTITVNWFLIHFCQFNTTLSAQYSIQYMNIYCNVFIVTCLPVRCCPAVVTVGASLGPTTMVWGWVICSAFSCEVVKYGINIKSFSAAKSPRGQPPNFSFSRGGKRQSSSSIFREFRADF